MGKAGDVTERRTIGVGLDVMGKAGDVTGRRTISVGLDVTGKAGDVTGHRTIGVGLDVMGKAGDVTGHRTIGVGLDSEEFDSVLGTLGLGGIGLREVGCAEEELDVLGAKFEGALELGVEVAIGDAWADIGRLSVLARGD